MNETNQTEINWKTNLGFIWTSQVLSLMAFSFAMSFAAYYIQDLGVTDPKEVKFWNGAFAASAPLAMAVMGPVWGVVGDRYGRRLMMLRAYYFATIIVFLMSCVVNVQQLIILRVLQGALTGTITSSAVLVAVSTPKERQGLALGSLQAGMLLGWMVGSSLGGLLADTFGYARTIRFGSVIMLLAAIIVTFGVRENFTKPTAEQRLSGLQGVKKALPILVIIFFAAVARRFDMTFVPLVVQELNGGELAGSATQMGKLTACCCIAMTGASVLIGHLSDRVNPSWILMVTAFGAAIFAFLQYGVETYYALVGLRCAMMLFVGGMEPAFQTWLSRSTSATNRGGVFGFSSTFKALGWTMASVTSTGVAMSYGIRFTFVIAAMLFVCMAPIAFVFAKRLAKTDEAVPSIEPLS